MNKKFKKFSAMLLSVATAMSFSVNSLTAMAEDFADELKQQDIFDDNGFIDWDKFDDYVIDSYEEDNSGDKITFDYHVEISVFDEINYLLMQERENQVNHIILPEYTDIILREKSYICDDLDIQLTLAETDKTGNVILNKIATWNIMDEPLKRFDISCTVDSLDERRYFQVFIDKIPEGYSSEELDWKSKNYGGHSPRIVLDEQQQANDEIRKGLENRDEIVYHCPVRIYNCKEKELHETLESIYDWRFIEDNPGEIYNMIKSEDLDIEALKATATTPPTTVDTKALLTLPCTTSENGDVVLVPDTTTTTTTATNMPVAKATPEVTLSGDANCDDEVTISDSVLIMQTIINPDEFKMTAQGKANADVVGDGDGVTLSDAFEIQEIALRNFAE